MAFAIADASRPRLLIMRMHELQVEQSFCRQKHVTHLVHAIEEASPAGSSIEVHVHAASTPALSFYSALKFEWHAQMDDSMVVLRRRKPEAPRQLLTSQLPSSLVHQQGAPSLPSPAALRQT